MNWLNFFKQKKVELNEPPEQAETPVLTTDKENVFDNTKYGTGWDRITLRGETPFEAKKRIKNKRLRKLRQKAQQVRRIFAQ